MATVVQLKRSETTGAIPGAGDIAVGELAVNLADGALYSKRTDGAIIEIGGAAIVFVDQSDMGQVSDAGGNSYDLGTITDAGATTSTQYTDALARAAVSVTDSGGDGSLAYNSSTGVITYTGPSAANVRAHFSAGTGITITDGVLSLSSAPSGGIVGTTDTQTLTNKRITPRVNAQTTTTSPWAWNSDSYDQQSFSALANALTINADAGTPTDGQRTIFRFEDSGTARALTWTTGATKAFRAIGVTLPTTTVVGKTTYVGCIYNTVDSRWDVVAVSQEA